MKTLELPAACIRCGKDVYPGDRFPFPEGWACSDCAPILASQPVGAK